MNLSDVIESYPQSMLYLADGRRDGAYGYVTQVMSRTFGPSSGTGIPRDYDDHDVRLVVAHRVVSNAFARVADGGRLGVNKLRVLAQLREQTRDQMPERLRVEAADVEVVVDVPFVLLAELNGSRVRGAA